jgi:F0F1-type ATP synthase assembly protein I
MKGMKAFGKYGAVGFELLASIAVGYYLGHWLDGKFGTRWIGLIGFVIGCYAGFRALFRASKQMQKDVEREEKLARGEDPWEEPVKEPPVKDEGDGQRKEP